MSSIGPRPASGGGHEIRQRHRKNHHVIVRRRKTMATYTIQVLNASGFAKSYVLFMPPPLVTGAGGHTVVYTNAWVTFDGILPNGIDSVTYTDLTFAYWATSVMPVAFGATMGRSGFAAVDVTKRDSVPFIGTVPTGFGKVTPGGALAGAYRIVASGDFNASNGYMFGMALTGNVPSAPSPVATFTAEPNDTFNVVPTTTKCYVSDGAVTRSQIIDYAKASTKAGIVDFAGRAQTSAIVTQGTNGLFTTQYY
jgi:hypothetical protein